MNRTKIEEKLKEANEKLNYYYSVEVDEAKWTEWKGRYDVLAELLAEDGGEVKEYSANFLFGFHDNSVEALGYEFANAKTEAYQKEIWTALVEKIASQQAPSATVDEKIKDIAQRLAQHVTFDRQEAVVSGNIEVGYTNHNVAELIEEGITEYLHSQQPTVDVDVLWEKWKSATMQVNILGDKRDIVFKIAFEHAIQEALRGSYTRSDLANFANMISLADDGEKFEENAMNDLLTQYDTERGKSNG